MIVIGLDPGLKKTGFGILIQERGNIASLEHGCIWTNSNDKPQNRLWEIYQSLEQLVLKYNPVAFGVERLFFDRNITSALEVSQARGVMLTIAGKYGIEIGEYTPTQVKLAVTGYGKATKDQVGQMVCTLLGIKERPSPPDVCDALAAGICHIQYITSPLLKATQTI